MFESSSSARRERLVRFGTIAAAIVLVAIGIGAVVKGLDGRSTVRNTLATERVVGQPFMSPKGIAAKAQAAGLSNVKLPDCSVANKTIGDGNSARCFAQYMRIDALIATHGKTYAQMPSFVAAKGGLTNDITQAATMPSGGPVGNPARNVWVTETALSTALNTSYMAEQTSLFGIAVGAAMLLIGLALAGLSLTGVQVGRIVQVRAKSPATPRAAELSHS